MIIKSQLYFPFSDTIAHTIFTSFTKRKITHVSPPSNQDGRGDGSREFHRRRNGAVQEDHGLLWTRHRSRLGQDSWLWQLGSQCCCCCCQESFPRVSKKGEMEGGGDRGWEMGNLYLYAYIYLFIYIHAYMLIFSIYLHTSLYLTLYLCI